ncbi:MAG: DUF1272 domain-containing protein [Actinobacteria bacterium]|nr:DUF1272 domain-containing protein [Actinomycetota bacterium]
MRSTPPWSTSFVVRASRRTRPARSCNRGNNDAVLEMRTQCEKCETSLEPTSDQARICSYECTFCASCADAMSNVCPNCSGQLVPRPTRAST